MTLKQAVRQMRENEAAKRPSMNGYVYRDEFGLSEEDVAAGKYRLVLVGKDGTKASFPMGGLGEDGKDAQTILADASFIINLIEDNWEIALRDDLESARAGSGNW